MTEHALSVKQPWAWAIIAGIKDIENRTWKPPSWLIGKRFAVHASKKLDNRFETKSDVEAKFGSCPDVLYVGKIIGFVTLVGFVSPDESHPSPWRDEGSFGWILADPVALDNPQPCKGQLGIWKIPEELRQPND